MIVGYSVLLRALEKEDMPQIVQWRNDPEVYRYFFEYEPQSLIQQERWFELLINRSDEKLFMITTKQGEALGTIGLVRIDWRSRKAYLGRFYIGNPKHRLAAFGAEAEFLMLQYSFDHLNLNRLYCEVFAFNKAVISLHKRLGFQVEGVLRQDMFHEEKYEDVVVMGLLRDEYLSLQPSLMEFFDRVSKKFGDEQP